MHRLLLVFAATASAAQEQRCGCAVIGANASLAANPACPERFRGHDALDAGTAELTVAYLYYRDVAYAARHVAAPAGCAVLRGFPRVLESSGRKHRRVHPGVVLESRRTYWTAGGCDEDLVGHYGFTDLAHYGRVEKAAGCALEAAASAPPPVYMDEPREKAAFFAVDANRGVLGAKLAGDAAWGKAPLVVISMLPSLRAAAVVVVASMLLSLRAAAALAPPLLRRARRGAARAASVYESPELYDAAFGFRDFASEVDFLLGAHERHGSTGPAASVLELAAGPARHAVEAAARA
ncbi:hypothetical protein JL722_4948 [Aureococcus anophagefferens]|nr:hypothetical protein JL722_4948 [Aureococcus anophagefferens]